MNASPYDRYLSLPFSLDPSVSSAQMDRYLRSRLTRSILFHIQSPTTAAPATPIGDDTLKALLTVQHDDYTLLIHAFITGLEAGPPVSHKSPHAARFASCYIRCFVILTPFFPPHPTPRRFFGPILPLPRGRVLSTRSLRPRQSLSIPQLLGPLPYQL
jgi:hypothetical protein